jgi:hypothetical protein
MRPRAAEAEIVPHLFGPAVDEVAGVDTYVYLSPAGLGTTFDL